jgi:hypothetical protein
MLLLFLYPAASPCQMSEVDLFVFELKHCRLPFLITFAFLLLLRFGLFPVYKSLIISIKLLASLHFIIYLEAE